MDLKSQNDNIYNLGFYSGLRPDPLMTVSEWADAKRMLVQKASAEPGKWKTSRTPFLREIMDNMSSMSEIQESIFMKGAQIGGSESGNNFIGYTIDHAPGPMLIVQPTVELAKRYSKQRIDPLIDSSPSLRDRIKPARERESGNTVLSKEFADGSGILLITGANSSVGLRSMPARKLFLDEEDAYPGDVDGEGDPVMLAKARTRTYKNKKKIFRVSTPTIAGASRIEAAFMEGDQRRYHVPCPHCGVKQVLKWINVKWEDNKPETTYYLCEANACVIEEHHKTKMLAAGEWIPDNPGAGNGKIRSYHLSSLYSPVGWYSWSDAVADWINAKSDPSKLKAFVNTVLGEVWAEKGEAPEWKLLYDRRETYQLGTIPQPALFITCGVDVQKDRLEAQVVGWGKDKQSWVVDYLVFPGDTSDLGPAGPWVEIDKLLQKQYPHESGLQIPIKLMAIDSGDQTQTVYSFVRKYPANRVVATKGYDHLKMVFSQPSTVDVHVSGKKIRRGSKVWPIGSSMIKVELYGLLHADSPTEEQLELHGYPPGFVHFPELPEEYFRQLTAEQLIKKFVKGFPRYYWEKKYNRNEALDTFILSRVAASICGLDRYTKEQWQALQMTIQPTIKKSEANNDTQIQQENNSEIRRRKPKNWSYR